MPGSSYHNKRHQLQEYFDRTAVSAWERLTSDAPVSRIRQTVRAGRRDMRNTLLDWLPADLTGRRLLDAGCGTGALAIEAARRGAEVTGIDISPNLIALARKRTPERLAGRLQFAAGDMLGGSHGDFDHIVAMDSLIHYRPDDMLHAVASLRSQLRQSNDGLAGAAAGGAAAPASLLFTFAPRTLLLMALYHVGKLFPRADRSPAIEPIAESHLRELISRRPELAGLRSGRSRRIDASFYKSQAIELVLPAEPRPPEPLDRVIAVAEPGRTGRVPLTGQAANA